MKPFLGFSFVPMDNLPFPVGGKLPPEVFQMSMTENVTLPDCEHRACVMEHIGADHLVKGAVNKGQICAIALDK